MNDKKKSVPVFGIIFAIIFIFLVGVAAKSIVAKKNGEINFFFNKYAVLYVLSGSMEPVIPTGSYIIIEKTDVSQIQQGDVISFYSDDPAIEGGLNTHRVIEVLDGEYVTKGDNVSIKDEYTAKVDKVVGEYVGNFKLLTVLAEAFRSNIGFAVVFIFLIATMIISLIRIVIVANSKTVDDDGDEDNADDGANAAEEKSEDENSVKEGKSDDS